MKSFQNPTIATFNCIYFLVKILVDAHQIIQANKNEMDSQGRSSIIFLKYIFKTLIVCQLFFFFKSLALIKLLSSFLFLVLIIVSLTFYKRQLSDIRRDLKSTMSSETEVNSKEAIDKWIRKYSHPLSLIKDLYKFLEN